MAVTGMPGQGKTSFMASAPGVLVIDVENQAGDIPWDVPRASPNEGLTTMADYIKLFEQLEKDGQAGKAPFGMLAFDTLDAFVDLAIRHLEENDPALTRNGDRIFEYGKGSGWFILRDFVTDWVNRLYMAGYGIMLGFHLSEKRVNKGEDVIYTWKAALPPSIFEHVYRKSQVMAYVRRTEEVTTEEITKTIGGKTLKVPKETRTPKYVLEVTPLEGGGEIPIATKARYCNYLPGEIEIPMGKGYAAFTAQWNEAIRKTQEEFNGSK